MREQRDRTHLNILLFLQRTYILNDSHIIELYLISALINNKLPQLEKRSVVVHVQMVSILLKKLSTYIRSKKCKLMLPHIGINEHCLIGTCIRWKCIYTCEPKIMYMCQSPVFVRELHSELYFLVHVYPKNGVNKVGKCDQNHESTFTQFIHQC